MMFEVVHPLRVRVARRHRIERAPGSAWAMATKLYWPPTPLTTWPSASASDTAAPSSVTIMVVLMQRAARRCSTRSSWSGPYSWFT